MRRVSAAIYAQPRGGLKAAMIEALRQAKPARGLRRTTLAGSAMVLESLRIINRPEEIEARLVPGHWEGDLIKGAFNRSSVGGVCQTSCPPISCGVSGFRGAGVALGIEPDWSDGLPVAGFA